MWLAVVTMASAGSIGFDDALREALASGPAAAVADAERRIALGEARTQGTWLANPEAALDHDVDGTRASLSLPVPLAGQPIARARAGAALHDAATLGADLARVRAALGVGRTYLEAERTEQLARLAEDTLAIAERSRDAARKLLEANEVSVVDAVTLEALAARAVQDATIAQQDALRARLALEVELGRTPTGETTTAGWPDLPDPPQVDVALPAVRIAREEAQGAGALATAARMDVVPTPVVQGGWSTHGAASGPLLGVAVELPIFAPGAGAVQSAIGAADRADALAERAALESRASWITATGELRAAADAWDASRIDGLDDALTAIGVALETGEYSLAEYVARRDAIVGGLVTAIDSRHRLEVARLALWSLLGELPPERGP